MNFKVLVTGKIDEVGIQKLQAAAELEVDLKFHLPMPELLEIIHEYDALVTRSETAITEELLTRAKRLKLVARGGVGVDNIDIDGATRHGVYVCNTPGANTIAATEQTFALLLSLMRNTFRACHNLKNEREWHRTEFTGNELFGKRLGIVGLGRIGSQVAKRARAFEMSVSAYDPYIPQSKADNLGVKRYERLPDMLAEIDILTVHAPKTQETNGMIGARELALMPKGARVVNCARGGIVEEKALYDALVEGQIAGAALDVFANEPATDHPLLELPNVVVTPHLGASTVEAQANVGIQLADQVLQFLLNGKLDNMLNVPVTDSKQTERIAPYISMVSQIARLQKQLVDVTGLTAVTLELFGPPADAPELIMRGLLECLLGTAEHENINVVNAITMAEQRGMALTHRNLQEASGYDNLLRVTLEGKYNANTISAARFENGIIRIVEINGHHFEIEPEGTMLIITNEDQPGVIGAVGTMLGQAGINIADWRLGRSERGGVAMAVVRTDQALSADGIRDLSSIAHILSVDQVQA